MSHILSLATASAALTTILSLLAAVASEPVPTPPGTRSLRAPVTATAEAGPVRTIRTIPIDGRYDAAVRPTLR